MNLEKSSNSFTFVPENSRNAVFKLLAENLDFTTITTKIAL
jgi:hypothetical protein